MGSIRNYKFNLIVWEEDWKDNVKKKLIKIKKKRKKKWGLRMDVMKM